MWGVEGIEIGCVYLHRSLAGKNLPVEDHHDPSPGAVRIGGDGCRTEQVCWSVPSLIAGGSHGPSHGHGDFRGPRARQEIGTLLEDVGAMGDHNPSNIAGRRDFAGPLSQLPESVRPQVASRNPGPILYPVRSDLFQSRGK